MWKKESPEGEELSLRALSEAFREAMGRTRAPDVRPPKGGNSPVVSPTSEGSNESETNSSDKVNFLAPSQEVSGEEYLGLGETLPSVEISPLSILEALLFVGDPQNRPVRPEMAASVMRNVQPEEIPELVRELNRRYESAGCPYHIVSEGPGYRMTLRKPYWHLRNRFYARIRETKLSQAAIDVLAIVAYQQPVTAEQVQHLRGKPSASILSHLVQRQLLRVERAQDGSRKAYYSTTDRFLTLFGLESLEDLPKTEDIDKK